MTEQTNPTQSEVGQPAGGGHANFPPFDASTFPAQILWLAITFGALYYVMAKIALPRVGAVISERKARIAKDLDDATAMQQQADAAAAAHQKTLADARLKAQGLAQEARDRLAAEAETRRKTLEGELAARLALAEQQIAETRAQAMTNVESIAREAAGAIVERLLGRPADGRRSPRRSPRSSRTEPGAGPMEFDAEFFVTIGFLVFLCLLGYLGAHRMVLSSLDARGKAIADELAQAAKLRDEATALLASFGKRAAEAEANAAAIVAEARAQAEQLAKETAERMADFVARRTKQAETKIAMAEAQAAADVRAAAADHAARAAERVLRDQTQGAAGAELVAREISGLKDRLN